MGYIHVCNPFHCVSCIPDDQRCIGFFLVRSSLPKSFYLSPLLISFSFSFFLHTPTRILRLLLFRDSNIYRIGTLGSYLYPNGKNYTLLGYCLHYNNISPSVNFIQKESKQNFHPEKWYFFPYISLLKTLNLSPQYHCINDNPPPSISFSNVLKCFKALTSNALWMHKQVKCIYIMAL